MQRQNKNERMLTPKEAAALANVSTRTLRRWEDEGLIHGVKTATGNKRYAESSILEAMNGTCVSNSSLSERPNTSHHSPNACAPRSYPSECSSRHTPPRKTSPDDAFTSWDKETRRARAALEITKLKHDKYALDMGFEEKRVAQKTQREILEQNQREHEWLARIKQAGIAHARESKYIPNKIASEKVPVSILRRIATALDETINLTTCPLPENPFIKTPGSYEIQLAQQCADELIQPWIDKRAEDYKANHKPLFAYINGNNEGSDASEDEEDDWEDDDGDEGEWDDEDDDSDFDDEWGKEDDDEQY